MSSFWYGWRKVVLPGARHLKVVLVNGKLVWGRSNPTGRDGNIMLDVDDRVPNDA